MMTNVSSWLGLSIPVTLGLSSWAIGALVFLFLAICVLMILTVLIQKAQGGGLAGAFGGAAGSGQTAFGAKTGDALTVATITIFVLYLVTAVGLNYALTPVAAPEGTNVSSTDKDGQGEGSTGTETAPAPGTDKPTETPKPDSNGVPASGSPTETPATSPEPATSTPPSDGTAPGSSVPAEPAPVAPAPSAQP